MKIKIVEDSWTEEMDEEYCRLYYQKMTTNFPLSIDEKHKFLLLKRIREEYHKKHYPSEGLPQDVLDAMKEAKKILGAKRLSVRDSAKKHGISLDRVKDQSEYNFPPKNNPPIDSDQ